MSKLFLIIYNSFQKRSLYLWLTLALVTAPVAYFALSIKFEEDISNMIPDSKETQRYQEALSKSSILDKLVITISADSSELRDTVIAATDQMVQWLQGDSATVKLITDIRYRIEEDKMSGIYDLIYRNLPLYLDEKDYQRIDSVLSEEAVTAEIEKDYHRLVSPASIVFKKFILKDPLSFSSPVLLKLKKLQSDTTIELYDGYLMKKNQRSSMIILSLAHPPKKTRLNGKLIDSLDQFIGKLQQRYPNLHTEYFGGAAVAVANARQIEKDIKLTASLAIFVIIVLLYFFYRNVTIPFLVLLPVSFGVAFSLAAVSIIQGSISVIALGAGAVVLGVAVDYSLHIFAHYKHTRSIEEVIKDVSVPMLIGSTSTVGAFFSLLFVDSKILYDFGMFSGFSLIGAALFSLIFLPQWVSKIKFKHTEAEDEGGFIMKHLLRLITMRPEKFGWAVMVMALLTVVFYWFSSDVKFESDLSKINYMPPHLKQAEQNLYASMANEDSREKPVFLIYSGKSISDVLSTQERTSPVIDSLMDKGDINTCSGALGVLVSDSLQRIRLERWNQYWTPEKKSNLKKWVQLASEKQGFKPEAFSAFYDQLDRLPALMNDEDQQFLINVFLKDFIHQKKGSVEMLYALRVPTNVLLSSYKVFSDKDDLFVLDRQAFYNNFVEVINQDFNQILYTCSFMVFMILLISYGRIEMTLITFVPMMISWIWILGLMALLDIKFNIVNIIISTFIFGLGDDYAIFFTDGLQKEYETGKQNIASYKISVFLSAVSTIVGMGVLIFAQHPALKSIAMISVIGIVCVVITSYTFIPWLFKTTITNRVQRGLSPLTIGGLLRSLWVYTYFILGCLFLTILGVIIFKIFRAKQTGKLALFYHWMIYGLAKSMGYIIPVIRKIYVNKEHEDFSKPAIIIANHQSRLDIMLLLMLHPRLIMVTNSWVWNSPLFGAIVRMAGFINTTGGVVEDLSEIRERVKAGYSIVIFPEGKRSDDFQINRFHKGAFYLAEELKLDILPIVLFGTGIGLRKRDFVLNRIDLYIKILPRITSAYINYGKGYSERTKAVSKYFRTEYDQLIKDMPASTFYHRILSSYVYKGPVLEWYYRIKVKLEKSYNKFDHMIPSSARIYDVGCGYGFLSYFLLLKSSKRKITGIDYDEDKIQVASHSFLKDANIDFITSDVENCSFENADVILLLDILHYLPGDKQKRVLNKCIDALSSGGMLLVRDGNSNDKKHNITRLTEWFSVKVFGFNKSSEEKLTFFSINTLLESLDKKTVTITMIKDSKITSNIIYSIVKNG